jgi:hypothetical protein
MTAQDEIRLKEWFGQLHVLVEGLQAQINALRVEVAGLQKSQPTAAATTPKKAAKAEEPVTP